MSTQLLNDVRSALCRYVVMPDDVAADAVTLWIAATHAQTAWSSAPRLVIKSPERRCGKSRLLDVLEATCHAPFMAFNATVAAVVRSIDADDPPTLLFDEADAIWPVGSGGGGAENLRALLNAGFGRGRPIVRVAGTRADSPTVKLPSFAMAALAGIGDTIPDTVTDRAVVIRMRRRLPHESVSPYRERRDGAALRELSTRLGEWTADQLDTLADYEPALPVTDRAADLWEPLVSIADAAGGSWPERARIAAESMTAKAVEDEAEAGRTEHRILAALRDVFDSGGHDRMSTSSALADLAVFGITTDASALAAALRPYEIRSRNLKMPGGAVLKGYRRQDFADAWNRYLTTPE
jgi:hypothetical protein